MPETYTCEFCGCEVDEGTPCACVLDEKAKTNTSRGKRAASPKQTGGHTRGYRPMYPSHRVSLRALRRTSIP